MIGQKKFDNDNSNLPENKQSIIIEITILYFYNIKFNKIEFKFKSIFGSSVPFICLY